MHRKRSFAGKCSPFHGCCYVWCNSNILLIDQAGKIIRLSAKDIRAMGRQAKGVRLIRLDESQKLHNVVAFDGSEDASSGDDSGEEETGVIIETRSLPISEDESSEVAEEDSMELDEEVEFEDEKDEEELEEE